jgi:hypothetical protein
VADGWSIDGISRVLGGLGLLGLALITGVISYQHGLEVARMAGAVGIVAYLVPLVADLMIATSSLSILDAARNGGGKPVFAWISLVFGALGTVVMNVAAAWGSGLWPCLLNGGVPVALILSYEALMEMIRRARQRALGDDEPDQPEANLNQCPHLPAKTADDAPVVAFLHARDCMDERPTLRQHAATWGVNRATLSERLKKIEEPTESEPAREPVLNGSGPA